MSGRAEPRIVPDKSWDLDDIVAKLADLLTISQKRRYKSRSRPE